VDVFLIRDEDGSRTDLMRIQAELRRAGIAADTDYAGRSRKGQLTQAGRLGARATVFLGADGATIRERGRDDRRVDLGDLVATLAR
jgi:histidyl-tRNA synthetase